MAMTPLMADEGKGELSMNAALSTDYVFRYISQTQEDSAVSAGIDWDSGQGFYLGLWGSNVDFNDDARLEIDFYAGYTFETESGLAVDVGLIDYEYFNNESNDNILEGFTSLARGPASLTVYYDLKHGDYAWVEGAYSHDLGPVTADVTLGTLIPDEGERYAGWSIGASYTTGGIDYALTAYGTNSEGELQFGRLADTRLVFNIAAQFE
jgi:uncharacterized protein (TIGR02001 family)